MNIATAELIVQSVTLLVSTATLFWMVYMDKKKK